MVFLYKYLEIPLGFLFGRLLQLSSSVRKILITLPVDPCRINWCCNSPPFFALAQAENIHRLEGVAPSSLSLNNSIRGILTVTEAETLVQSQAL